MASSLLLPGFYKAPVCKGLIASVFTSTAIHFPMLENLQEYLECEIPTVLMSKNIWRILFNRLTFIHSKDIICSALVIYYFRIFERRMGSHRFASFLFGTCTISTLLEILFIMVLKYFQCPLYSNQLPPGLYGILFPLYVYYYFDIPRTSVTSFLGIPFTEKTITYLFGLQIAVTSPETLTASACGIFAGLFYRKNLLGVQKWLVLPGAVAKICDKVFTPLLTKEPKHQQMGATIELQRQEQEDLFEQQYLYQISTESREVRGQGYAERLIDDQPEEEGEDDDDDDEEEEEEVGLGLANYLFRRRQNTRNVEPSQENVRILMEMGFSESRSIEALRSSSNDLETATNILLRQ